jgi:hypothetical protein
MVSEYGLDSFHREDSSGGIFRKQNETYKAGNFSSSE